VLYAAQGNDPRPMWLIEQLGLAGLLLQACLLAGVVLSLARRFTLPFGALTLVIGLSSFLLSVLEDRYWLALAAAGAGLLADFALAWLRPAGASHGRFYAFAFAIPALVIGSYFLGAALTGGIAWSLPLWLGAIVAGGLIGLLLGVALLTAEAAGQSPPLPT
jgi:hypothetical protein